jgi:hypothetical protein
MNILMSSRNSVNDLNNLNKRFGTNGIVVYKKGEKDIQSSTVEKTNIKPTNGIPIVTSTDEDGIPIDIIDESQLDKYNIDFPTTQCIVAITEAPTHNIFDWGTKSYSLDMGPIKKMVQTGYHDLKVWQSIMFQLLAAMHTMNLNDICINEMKLENNVFIRDLSRDESQIGYWKYIVNGIEYYVPNYGYLVVIDTKYNQLEDNVDTLNIMGDFNVKLQHNICGKIFNDDETSLELLKINNLINIFDSNNFKNKFLSYGGISPPPEIMDMMNTIKSGFNKFLNAPTAVTASRVSLSGTASVASVVPTVAVPKSYKETMNDIFFNTQKHFLNNRIGEYIKDIEKEQLIKESQSFSVGNIVAEGITTTNQINHYRWGLIIGLDIQNHVTIYTLEDNIKKIKNVPNSSLAKSYKSVEQNYKPNQKLTEEDILETYIISQPIIV